MNWMLLMNSCRPRMAALCFGFLLLLSPSGCATEGEKAGTGAPPPVEAARGPDILNVGDRVKVIFTDVPTPLAPTESQIPESGELTLQYGHKFMFKGKRRDALEQEIRDFYIEQKIYKIMGVTIEVPPRPISVGGEVRSPGTYPHAGQMTILKAIDMAGGFTEFSKKTKVKIIRGGKTITVDCKKAIIFPADNDVPIYPGDQVKVPRSWY